jgi:hypothetical protein
VKGAGHRKAAIPESEPDFYRQFPLCETQKAATVITAASLIAPILSVGGDTLPFMPAFPLYLQESKSPTSSQFQDSSLRPQQQESIFNPQFSTVPQEGPLRGHHRHPYRQLAETHFVQSATIPTVPATNPEAELGVQAFGTMTVDPGDGETDIDAHRHDLSSSDSSTSSSSTQSQGSEHSELQQQDPKRHGCVPSIAKKQTNLDPSLLSMGEQQALFSTYWDGTPSSPRSLASALCYQNYQNHDIIVDALRAVAPFYPDIK